MKKICVVFVVLLMFISLFGCTKSEMSLRNFIEYESISSEILPDKINVRIADGNFADFQVTEVDTIQLIMDRLNKQVFSYKGKDPMIPGGNGRIKLIFEYQVYIISTFMIKEGKNYYSYHTGEDEVYFATFLENIAVQRGIVFGNSPNDLNDEIWNSIE